MSAALSNGDDGGMLRLRSMQFTERHIDYLLTPPSSSEKLSSSISR
jgi:hypothetical protein